MSMDKIIKLRKKPVPCKDISVSVRELAFYLENPRIYSRFAGITDRSQENIQKMLEGMEHVKELRTQIDRDGQVNEPLYCIPIPDDSDLHGKFKYQVLEGNSRLAALCMSKRSSLPPPSVGCYVLDFSAYEEKVKESLIFSLLGQFHITGKANWESYENAAYIYRRAVSQGIELNDVAREIGKSIAKVRKMIEAFKMMIKESDKKKSNWSYYEAYVSSTKINKHRKNFDGLDDRVVSLIKEQKFPRALDMRDKLPAILSNKKARKTFFDERENDPFGEALEIAKISGDTDTTLKRLERFRMDLGSDDTKRQIRKLLRNSETKGKTTYELVRISKFAGELLKKGPATS